MATSRIENNSLRQHINAYKLSGQNINTITMTFASTFYGAIFVLSDYGIVALYKHHSVAVEKLGTNSITMSIDSTNKIVTISFPSAYPNGVILWQRTSTYPAITESMV